VISLQGFGFCRLKFVPVSQNSSTLLLTGTARKQITWVLQQNNTTQQTKRIPVTGSEEMLNFSWAWGCDASCPTCRHIGFQLLGKVFPWRKILNLTPSKKKNTPRRKRKNGRDFLLRTENAEECQLAEQQENDKLRRHKIDNFFFFCFLEA